jgi:cadmium resistance protein CadD (predicted permease)
MSPLLTVLAASVTTFAATNLDDIFLLTVFFARRVPTRRIVAGQCLGFAAIIAELCWIVGCGSDDPESLDSTAGNPAALHRR